MKNLMTTKPFDCTYNMYHVVTGVSHLNVLRVEVILLRVEVILLQVEVILLQVEVILLQVEVVISTMVYG